MSIFNVVHEFRAQLQYSNDQKDHAFWNEVYAKAFPKLKSIVDCSADMGLQKIGVDRKIIMSSGKEILIDEKKRKSTYNDILIEYISNDQTGSAGWVEKDLHIDYIAYAFMPIKMAYLLPFDFLQRAWRQYKNVWIAQYRRVEADNKFYKTISVAVPIDTLRKAVSRAQIIKV